MEVRGCGPKRRSRQGLVPGGLFFLIALCLAVPANGVSKFSIGPSRVEAAWKPGTKETLVIEAVNQGDDDLRLKAYAADFDIDEAGELSYPKPGQIAHSCADWFRFNPQTAEVAKGTSGPVRATARIPADASGAYRCVLFLEDVPPPSRVKKQMFAIQMNARLGSVLYINVGPMPPPLIRIEQLVASAGEDGQVEAEALVVHAAGGTLRPQGTWELVGSDGRSVEKSDVGFPLLPDHRRRARWSAEPGPGSYIVRLSLDYGGEKRLIAEAPVTVSSAKPKAPTKK